MKGKSKLMATKRWMPDKEKGRRRCGSRKKNHFNKVSRVHLPNKICLTMKQKGKVNLLPDHLPPPLLRHHQIQPRRNSLNGRKKMCHPSSTMANLTSTTPPFRKGNDRCWANHAVRWRNTSKDMLSRCKRPETRYLNCWPSWKEFWLLTLKGWSKTNF